MAFSKSAIQLRKHKYNDFIAFVDSNENGNYLTGEGREWEC